MTLLDTPPGYRYSPLGLLVPEPPPRDRPVAIDFFAGAGGFSMGFHQAGFHVAAAIEMDYWAAVTYMVNLGRPARHGGVQMHYDTTDRADGFQKVVEKHLGLRKGGKPMGSASAEWRDGNLIRAGMMAGDGWLSSEPEGEQRYGCEHFWIADIRNLTGAEILDALQMDVGEVAAIIGGPPCQGFSTAGKRNVMDPRNSLVFEYARLICEIQPRTFVMENVPAIESMLTPEGMPVLDAFALAVSDGGYGEYDSLRRALSAMGGEARAGTRESTRGQRHDGSSRAAEPTKTARAAVAKTLAAHTDQLDLFGGES